jgi:hypothetical protein
MFGLTTSKKETYTQTKSSGLSFIKTNPEIFDLLTQSKATGALIGVYSPRLGEGMFLTRVESIHMETMHKEKIVVLNRYDMSGHILATTRVALSEIRTVCPFNQVYKNPAMSVERSLFSQNE